MIDRLINIPKNNSFFLFGPRGAGKTSLIRHYFSNSSEVLFIDLLNEDLVERYSVSPQLLKQEIDAMEKKPRWIVLDEVQKVPKLLNVAHQLIESKDKIHFVLMGSSSRKLKQKGVNLLAGRAWLRSIYPFSYFELKEQFILSDVLNWGTLPQIYSYKSSSDKSEYLKAYAQTYIRSEIQEEQWVRKLVPFRKFLPIAAQMNGKPLNYSKISRDVGVEVPTVQSYFEILEDTLLGFHLPAYGKSLRKQQRQSPKFYFNDTGIKKSLQKTLDVKLKPQTTEWGYAFEHFVICEFIRLNDYFSKDLSFSYLLTKDNFEVDLIAESATTQPLYIEIKSATKVSAKDFSKFSQFLKGVDGKGFVLSLDPIERIEEGIYFMPWQKGLEKVFDLS